MLRNNKIKILFAVFFFLLAAFSGFSQANTITAKNIIASVGVTLPSDTIGKLDNSLAFKNGIFYLKVNGRFSQVGTKLSVIWFGAKGDGITDCASAITTATAIANNINATLYFPSGTYLINSLLSVSLIRASWLGEDSSSVITGGFGDALVNLLGASSGSIKNLSFKNTFSSSSQSGVGVIYTSHIDIINFTIENCRFTCPTANTDALCFLTNIGDSTVPQHKMYNLNIIRNHFISIGRVAVDIFNRKFDLVGYQQAKNIHVDNNFCDSTGTKGSFGMFISYDGSGEYCTVNDNYIRNAAPGGGIEVGNYDNSKIMGNTIEFTTRAAIPIEVDPAYPVYNLVIANNKTIGLNTYCTFFLVNNSQFYGNNFRGNVNTLANDGSVYFVGCNKNTFTGEIYSSTTCALRMVSQPTAGTRYAGYTNRDNVFRNCTFIGSAGVSSRVLLSFDSSLTTNNIITQCNFYKGADSTYARFVQGSINNYIYDNYHDGVLSNVTINPIYALSNNPAFTGTINVGTRPLGTNDNTAASTSFVLANTGLSDETYILVQTALGGVLKAQTVGFTLTNVNSTIALASGTLRFIPVYLRSAQTITGIKWVPSTTGSYTPSNTNGVALYTWSAGTLTLVAQSANTGGIWSTFFTGGALGNLAFSSPYAAGSGIYFVALLYSSSAETTAPFVGTAPAMTNTTASLAGLANSTCLSGFMTGQTAFPSTQAFTGITPNTTNIWVGLY